ncbi:Protein YeeZ [Carnimonas sp. R-84981]|uniref:SDR family oxidoreductase n=1 Tax=Carnimonas bestiolae TaxID=3402172 RepID=UPI003EDC9828
MASRTILIVGCGDIGSALGLQLQAQGYRVIGARRDSRSVPASFEAIQLDVGDNASVSALPDADVLVYAISADKFEESAYQSAYSQGLDNILSEFEQRPQPPRQVLFVSSTSVYAQSSGEVVDESSPTTPDRFSGQIMCQAEQRLINSPLPGSVVRLSGIYGPGRERLINQARDGYTVPQNPAVFTNRIHRDDAAGVLAFLIERYQQGDAVDDIYLASDDEPATLYEVMTWLAQRLDVTPSQQLDASARRRSNKRCSNARLKAQGYRFRYPSFREGYADVLENLK